MLVRPPRATFLYVLAHGAGAPGRHPFLEALAGALADRRVATWRYDFPYMKEGRKIPDRAPVLEAAVRAEMARAAELALPIVAGGKSMGGRMTSRAQAAEPLPGVRGLAFVGFPLHRPKQPDTSRADHLASVGVPMLFVQGSRDEMADLPLLRGVIGGATLHVVEGADHAFRARGRKLPDVIVEIAEVISRWGAAL